MNPHRPRGSDERGMAMVMALLVLMVISVIATLMMMGLQAETRIAGSSMRQAEALNVAEAGIAEAVSRIRVGDIEDTGANPRMVAQIFNAPSGNVPASGADTIGLATAQPAGAWLEYSTATKGRNVLTVEYKTDAAKTVVYRYDKNVAPPIQTLSGYPIFVITSTGRVNRELRRVVSEVIRKPVNINIHGSVTAGVDVKFTGNARVCGYNHRADTPTNRGDNGRGGADGCNEDPGVQHWELPTGHKPGIWSTDDVNSSGGAVASGTPDELENQTGFYAGPWEALGMSQAEFYSWIGPRTATLPGDLNGVYYLDDNSTTQDHSGNYGIHGATGSGLLYVDGDLTLNSTFSYRGLIYVEGNLNINGSAWVLGALVVKGQSVLKNNGGATVLYSYDAITQNISQQAGTFVTLSWQER